MKDEPPLPAQRDAEAVREENLPASSSQQQLLQQQATPAPPVSALQAEQAATAAVTLPAVLQWEGKADGVRSGDMDVAPVLRPQSEQSAEEEGADEATQLQADKERARDREQDDIVMLSSSIISSKAAAASSSSFNCSSSSPPAIDDDGGLLPVTRRPSLLDLMPLDDDDLQAIDRELSSRGSPAAAAAEPASIPDIESLAASPAFSPQFIPVSHHRSHSMLAVTDLSSQLWCEHQTHLSLSLGRRVSPAAQAIMDRGTARHEQLEREVHDVVEVQVRGREEEWALRMVNGVLGLHELLAVGRTRELMVLARVVRRQGEQAVWIMGVIDEVERVDDAVMEQRAREEDDREQEERRKAEERRQRRYEKEEEQRRQAQQEAQRLQQRQQAESITRHFPVVRTVNGEVVDVDCLTFGGGSSCAAELEDAEMAEVLRQHEEQQEEEQRKRRQLQEELEAKAKEERLQREKERARQERKQNRARMQLQPSSSSFVLSDNKTRNSRSLPSIAQQRTSRMQLAIYKTIFDALATAEAEQPPAAAAASSASPLSCLWTVEQLLSAMELQADASFSPSFLSHLVASGFPATSTLPSLSCLYLQSFASLALPSSPYLSVHYEHQADASSLGHHLFRYEPLTLRIDLDWLLGYWLGLRHSEPVHSADWWKCSRCEYLLDCDRTRWEGRAERLRLRQLQDEQDQRLERQRQQDAGGQRAAEEVKEAEDVVEVAVEEAVSSDRQAKVRRGRKRRSVAELTMSQEDGKAAAATIKSDATQAMEVIDCT